MCQIFMIYLVSILYYIHDYFLDFKRTFNYNIYLLKSINGIMYNKIPLIIIKVFIFMHKYVIYKMYLYTFKNLVLKAIIFFFQVFFSSAKGGSCCQIYFMTLNKPGMANW